MFPESLILFTHLMSYKCGETDTWLVERVYQWDLVTELHPLITTEQTLAPNAQDGSVRILKWRRVRLYIHYKWIKVNIWAVVVTYRHKVIMRPRIWLSVHSVCVWYSLMGSISGWAVFSVVFSPFCKHSTSGACVRLCLTQTFVTRHQSVRSCSTSALWSSAHTHWPDSLHPGCPPSSCLGSGPLTSPGKSKRHWIVCKTVLWL